MTHNDAVARVLPSESGGPDIAMVVAEIAERADISRKAAQKAVVRLVNAGIAKRMDETYPPRYALIGAAGVAGVVALPSAPETMTARALRVSAPSVWALGDRAMKEQRHAG